MLVTRSNQAQCLRPSVFFYYIDVGRDIATISGTNRKPIERVERKHRSDESDWVREMPNRKPLYRYHFN